jgi:acetyl esterase/lipase
MFSNDSLPRYFSLSSSVPLAACLVLVLGSAGATAEEARKPAVKAIKDVAYYEGADAHPVKHKLDLFLPEEKKDYPVVLFVHGGGWVHGDKNFLGFYSALGRSLAQQGIGVVVTNYRLSPGVQHPEHVKDVARALAWTVKNIGRHGGKTDGIFLCGHSAGGHLVSLLATDESWLKEVGLTTNNIRGVIPISGVYSISDRLLPLVFGADGEGRRKASPITHVRSGLPPFLILCADKDFTACGREPSEVFCKALQGKGTSARVMEIKDSDHFAIIISAAMAESQVARAIVEFIQNQASR